MAQGWGRAEQITTGNCSNVGTAKLSEYLWNADWAKKIQKSEKRMKNWNEKVGKSLPEEGKWR